MQFLSRMHNLIRIQNCGMNSPEKLTGILQKCQDHEKKRKLWGTIIETKEKKQLNPNENLYKSLVQKEKKKT